eukprot:scaffold5270_cov42-Phaeocystis_antarctica.AAC.1
MSELTPVVLGLPGIASRISTWLGFGSGSGLGSGFGSGFGLASRMSTSGEPRPCRGLRPCPGLSSQAEMRCEWHWLVSQSSEPPSTHSSYEKGQMPSVESSSVARPRLPGEG